MIAVKKNREQGFWRQMWPYLRGYQLKIICCMVCAMVVGVFVAVQPLVIKYIVDGGITNDALADREKIRVVGLWCLFYIAISFGRLAVWRLGIIRMFQVLEGSLFNLRSRFFAHVQQLSMGFHEGTSAGELFNCIMGTPMTNIKTYMEQIFMSVPYQIVSLAISLSALLYYDWQMTLILLLTSLVMALFNRLARRKIKAVSRDYIQSEAETSRYLSDALQGMDAIKTYSIEADTFRQFRDKIARMYEKGVTASSSRQREACTPEFIQYVGTAVVYFVGAIACVYRGVSVGVLYAFLSSMGAILSILIAWLNLGLVKSSADAGLEQIMHILHTDLATPDKESTQQRSVEVERESAQSKMRPCIEFRDMSFAYDNKKIFEHFNCQIQYGESVAFVGGSGSGKSTLSKLAMRLYDVSAGQVLVHGKDVRDYSAHDLRVSFGVVPQNPFLFFGSIWDNVKIARPNATNKEIIHAMEVAHVHEFVNELENGWNTVVGNGGLDLSGGQKQRIAIARAVLGQPDILIFDEATSALDNISERAIQAAMESLMKDHTVIMIAHRLSTIRNVDRVIVLEKGKIVEEGSYQELCTKEGGAFAALL